MTNAEERLLFSLDQLAGVSVKNPLFLFSSSSNQSLKKNTYISMTLVTLEKNNMCQFAMGKI
jgi:hypothetical protein